MQQAVPVGEDLDERAVRLDALDGAFEDLSHLRLPGEPLDDLHGLGRRGLVGGGDLDAAVVLDVDPGSGLFLNRTDGLTAGSDDVADVVGVDRDRDDARRVARNVGPRPGDGGFHDVEKVQAPTARLLERALHHFAREPGDLDVHLQRVDSIARAGNLEVHVAVVVFLPGDVGEDRMSGAVGDESHGDAGDRRGDRHARVHERERSAAHRRHRR